MATKQIKCLRIGPSKPCDHIFPVVPTSTNATSKAKPLYIARKSNALAIVKVNRTDEIIKTWSNPCGQTHSKAYGFNTGWNFKGSPPRAHLSRIEITIKNAK